MKRRTVVVAWIATAFACGNDQAGDSSGTDAGIAADASVVEAGASVDAATDVRVVVPDADAPEAAPVDAGTDADAGLPCTPATVATDCPPAACPLALTGCVGGVCKYDPVAVCSARAFTGTFVTGGVDMTSGTVTVRGNIGTPRPEHATVCAGAVCITGGIAP